MIRMQSMARIMLITLGIHTCIRLLGILPNVLFGWTTGQWETVLSGLVGLILAGLLIFVTVKLLIINSGNFAQRIIPVEPPQETPPELHWLTAVLRLICIGVGIFYLISFTTEITRHITVIGAFFNYPSAVRNYVVAPVLRWMLTLPIAIYLLYGAPHFVRWQVRKTLDICSRNNK